MCKTTNSGEFRDEHFDPNPETEPELYRYRTETVPFLIYGTVPGLRNKVKKKLGPLIRYGTGTKSGNSRIKTGKTRFPGTGTETGIRIPFGTVPVPLFMLGKKSVPLIQYGISTGPVPCSSLGEFKCSLHQQEKVIIA